MWYRTRRPLNPLIGASSSSSSVHSISSNETRTSKYFKPNSSSADRENLVSFLVILFISFTFICVFWTSYQTLRQLRELSKPKILLTSTTSKRTISSDCVPLPNRLSSQDSAPHIAVYTSSILSNLQQSTSSLSCYSYQTRVGDDWSVISRRFPWMDADELKKYNTFFEDGSGLGNSLAPLIAVPSPAERDQLSVAFWRTGLLGLVMESDTLSSNTTSLSSSSLVCKVPVVVPGKERIWLPYIESPSCTTDGPPIFSHLTGSDSLITIDTTICGPGKRVEYRLGPSTTFGIGNSTNSSLATPSSSTTFTSNIARQLNDMLGKTRPGKRPIGPLRSLESTSSFSMEDAEFALVYCRDSSSTKEKFEDEDEEKNTPFNLHVRNVFTLSFSEEAKRVRRKAMKRFTGIDPAPTSSPTSSSASSLNIIVIVFDTVARAHFLRQMPLTTSYLEDLHLSGKHSLLQFLGLNVIGRGTYVNTGALFSGTPVGELTKESERDRWLFNFFKDELGYVTTYISDIGYSNANWFSRSPFEFASSWIDRYSWTTHHKLLAPFLHPSLPLYSSNSVSKRGRWCFAGEEEHRFPFKYLFEFHDNYQRNENFQLSVTHINGPHDRSMRMLTNYDRDFRELLKKFEKNGLLNTSALLVLGDHGTQRGRYYTSDAGQMEYRMPASFLLLPSHWTEKYPLFHRHLQENQQKLVTPYDLHETLVHLATLPNERPLQNYSKMMTDDATFNYNNGSSKPPRRPNHFPFSHSLLDPVPKNRTCEHANIPDWWCSCLGWVELDVSSSSSSSSSPSVSSSLKQARKVGETVIRAVNDLTGNGNGNCMNLDLNEVKSCKVASLELRKGETNLDWDMEHGTDKFYRSSYKIVLSAKEKAKEKQEGKGEEGSEKTSVSVFEAMVIDMGSGEGGGGGRGGGGGEQVVTSIIRLSSWGQETCDKMGYPPEFCVCKR